MTTGPGFSKKNDGQGKKRKIFIENKDVALELAEVIADMQEHRSTAKIKRQHTQAQSPTSLSQNKPQPSAKERLQEVTAALKLEKARAKKNRVRARKQDRAAATQSQEDGAFRADDEGKLSTRKRVAFA